MFVCRFSIEIGSPNWLSETLTSRKEIDVSECDGGVNVVKISSKGA